MTRRYRRKLLPLVAGLAAAGSIALTVPTAPSVGASYGAAWVPTRATFYDHEYLSAFPDGTVYATSDAGYSRSLDFGLTHHPMPPPDPLVSAWSSIRFGTKRVGYAVSESSHYDAATCGATRPRIWKTGDGGLSWSGVCLPAVASGYRFRTWAFGWSLAVSPGGAGVVVFGEEVESPAVPMIPDGVCLDHVSVAYLSSDGGASWTRFVLGGGDVMPAYIQDMHSPTWSVFTAYVLAETLPCTNGEPQSRVGNSQRVIVLDAATGPRTVLTCPSTGPMCLASYALTTNRLFVGHADASVEISDDGGATWYAGQPLRGPRGVTVLDTAPVSSEFWVQGFDFADATTGYASTNGYGTWRTTDGGATWVQERSHECEYRSGAGGDIEAATPERAVTAGPEVMSTRVPGPLKPTGCDGSRIADGEPRDWLDEVGPVRYRVTVDGVAHVEVSVG